MPARSKSQQRLFGMVHAYQKGKLKDAPESVKEIARSISDEDAEHFAKTKHKGLPEKKASATTRWLRAIPKPVRSRMVEVAKQRLNALLSSGAVVTPEPFLKNGINDWRVVNSLIGESKANLLRQRLHLTNATLPIHVGGTTAARDGWAIAPRYRQLPRLGQRFKVYPNMYVSYRGGYYGLPTAGRIPKFSDPKMLREGLIRRAKDKHVRKLFEEDPIDLGVTSLARYYDRRMAALKVRRWLMDKVNSGGIRFPGNVNKEEVMSGLGIQVPGAARDINGFNSYAVEGGLRLNARGRRIDRNSLDFNSGKSIFRPAGVLEKLFVPTDDKRGSLILAAMRRPDGMLYIPGNVARHELGHVISNIHAPVSTGMQRKPPGMGIPMKPRASARLSPAPVDAIPRSDLPPYQNIGLFNSPTIAEERAANYFGGLRAPEGMSAEAFESPALIGSYYMSEAKSPAQYKYLKKIIDG